MITIIDNYNKLSLGKYVRIQEVVKDDRLEEIDKQIKVLSLLSDIDEEEIMHIPIGDYKEMVRASRFLEDIDHNRHMVAKKYTFGDLELIPTTDYRKIETCQYVDFQTFSADFENRMVELLSVMLVPKGHRYNEGYDVMDVQEVIRERMSVTDAVSLVAFFLTLFTNSIKDSLNYSRQELKTIKDRNRRKEMEERVNHLEILLQGNGDGLKA